MKTLPTLFSFLILVTLTGCAPTSSEGPEQNALSTQEEEVPPTAETKKILHSEFGYMLEVPSTWKEAPQDQTNSHAEVVYNPEDALFIFSVEFEKSLAASQGTEADLKAKNTAYLKNITQGTSYKMLSEGMTTVSLTSAYSSHFEASFDYEGETIERTTILNTFYFNGHYYLTQMVYPTGTDESVVNKQKLNAIADSLSLFYFVE